MGSNMKTRRFGPRIGSLPTSARKFKQRLKIGDSRHRNLFTILQLRIWSPALTEIKSRARTVRRQLQMRLLIIAWPSGLVITHEIGVFEMDLRREYVQAGRHPEGSQWIHVWDRGVDGHRILRIAVAD